MKNGPLVSIIMPAYNQADYITQAIESVLQQSYQNWELLVVDDGSSDSTAQIVSKYENDNRIRYFFQENRGLPAARNLGIQNSKGDYLAFLDSDDAFLLDKIETQVEYLERKPDTGLCYGHRIEIDPQNNPLWLIPSPPTVSIMDLMLGFPFTINDFLIRRSWVEIIHGFDESYRLHGEDRDFYLRLALEGCKFSLINQVVAYRRIYPTREVKKVDERIELMERALVNAFNDPRCPATALNIKDAAYSNIYLNWALQEFLLDEPKAAHALFIKSLEKGYKLQDELHHLLISLVWFSIRVSDDHPLKVIKLIQQLHDIVDLDEYRDWMIFYGFIRLGMREILWGRTEKAIVYFKEAAKFGVSPDKFLFLEMATEMNTYELIVDAASIHSKLNTLSRFLKENWGPKMVRQFMIVYWLDHAFRDFQAQKYPGVLYKTMRAILQDPRQLKNRNLARIFIQSIRNTLNFSQSG